MTGSFEVETVQDFLYYENEGVDDDGEVTVAAKVPLKGRLIKGSREIQNGQSETFTVDGVLVGHDRTMKIHSLVQELINDGTQTDIYEIVESREVPDIKGRNIRRTAYLIRYKNSFPAIT